MMEKGAQSQSSGQSWPMDAPYIAKTHDLGAPLPGYKKSIERPKKKSPDRRDAEVVTANVQIHHAHHQQLSLHKPQRKRSDEVDKGGAKSSRRRVKDTCPLDYYGNNALPTCDRSSTSERAASLKTNKSAGRTSGESAFRHDSVMQAQKTPRQRDTEYQRWVSQRSPTDPNQRDAADFYGVPSNPHLDERDEVRIASEPPSSPMAVGNDELPDGLIQTVTQSSDTPTTTASTPQSPNIARIENRSRLERYFIQPGSRPSVASPEHLKRSTPSPANPLPPALPEFIAPTPAIRQRYVSAGGDAKLKDRPEIEPPPLALTPIKLDTTDLLPQMALLSPVSADPTPTRELTFFPTIDMTALAAGRLSAGSGNQTSTTPLVRGEKRGRTASAASMRDKIKRVFSSRKGSDAEDSLQGSFSS